MSSLLPTTATAASAGAELFTSDGRSLALVSAKLRGEVQGGIARLVLEQRFANHYEDNLRVTYRMPLPADGAVSGYEFEIGERVIKGVVDRKAQARERFERAVASGKTAALLEQERADIFTQQIGNIPARESVLARITIDQRIAWLPEGEWELRFPTVIGPRYIGSADTAADVRATHIKVTDEPLNASIQIELAIRDAIVAGGRPSSPTHSLTQRADGVTELSSGARLDRDIVVRWPVAAAAPGLSLATARPAISGVDARTRGQPIAGVSARSADAPNPGPRVPLAGTAAEASAFALLTIVPPAPSTKPVAVPRDLLVLLDTSGSMGGGPLEKAQQVVAMMLDSLDPSDRFELIEFSNHPRRYLEEPQMATPKAKAAAIKWVRSRVADGGTEMRDAVIEALTTLRVGAQRQVVIVTDGYVGGEHQILEALNRRLPKSCRVHVLGVGAAVNRSLATSLARAGRGAEVIVGIDEDAERGAKRLLDRTKSPMVTNVEIAGSALLRHAPEKLPDVFEGAPLVAALAIRPEGGELVVRGQLARDTYEQRISVPPQHAGDGNQAIVALYGRERVADVEANALFGSVDGEIEDLGLTFQIATRMTSWVAVDDTRRVVGPSRDELVPQELPYGTTAGAFGLRGGMPLMQMHQMKTMAGVAPRSFSMDAHMADDGDFGEEAPRESFVASAPRMTSYIVDKKAIGYPEAEESGEAAFGFEEPTGQAASELQKESAPASKDEPAPAPRAMSSMPAMRPIQQPGMPSPRQQHQIGQIVPAKRADLSFSIGRAAPPEPLKQASLAPARKSRLPWLVALALLAALIAAMIWWLVG